MMQSINNLPQFWQGVLSSVLAGLLLTIIGLILRIAFSSIREWAAHRKGVLVVLRQQLSSAIPAVRGEATIRLMFGVAQWLIISAFLYALSTVITFSGASMLDLALKMASMGSLAISLWWLSQYQRQSASEPDDWQEVLLSGSWLLVFNPPNRSKPISFLQNGEIGLGRNNNENMWRISDGKLEILQNDGQVHSRFVYYPRNSSFLHTNDSDTLSIRGQYIVSTRGG